MPVWVSGQVFVLSFIHSQGGLPVDGAAVVQEAIDAELDEIHAHE